jgi:hypothetical protein
VKWSTTDNGVVRAWINNALFCEKTSIKTDPEGYSEFSANNCIYSYGKPYPVITLESYAANDSLERTYWLDDIVAATEKVPDIYRVSN